MERFRRRLTRRFGPAVAALLQVKIVYADITIIPVLRLDGIGRWQFPVDILPSQSMAVMDFIIKPNPYAATLLINSTCDGPRWFAALLGKLPKERAGFFVVLKFGAQLIKINNGHAAKIAAIDTMINAYATVRLATQLPLRT